MERINKILNFVNSLETTETQKPINENHDQLIENQPIKKSKKGLNDDLLESSSTEDLVKDDKMYNKLRRKLKSTRRYPTNIFGKAFYSQQEVDDYIKELADSKRLYNKKLKAEAIANTKLNVDELEQISSDDEDDIITKDNMVYSTKKPIGIVKNEKRYRLPTTNKEDRKAIFDEVYKNKEVLPDLLKADDSEFNDMTLNTIKSEHLKKKTKQHMDNNIVKDNTWNKKEFIKLMEDLMELSKSEDEKKPLIKEPEDNNENQPIKNGFNPMLFKRFK